MIILKMKVPALYLISLLFFSIFLVSLPQVNSQVTPSVEVEKTVSSQQVSVNDTIQITIKLTGAGDMVQTPVDIVLILDRSVSMKGQRLEDTQEAAIKFLNLTDENDRVGLITYSSDVRIDSDLIFMNTTNKVLMEDYINDLTANGKTNIFDALEEANALLLNSSRINAPLVEVLLTDGIHDYPSELEWSEFEALANETRDNEIMVYTIGLGNDVNTTRLQDYAEITGGQFFSAPTSEDLMNIYIEIANSLSFSGTHIEVTETIPSYMSYNDDASITPDSETENSEVTLFWDIGTMAVGEEWEVTYTALAEEAIETSDQVILTNVQYTATDASPVNLNVQPGLIYNDIAVTLLEVKPDEVPQGNITDITATVESQGIIPVSFDVNISIPNYETLSTQSVTLNPGESKNVTFAWNTTDVDQGSYTINVLIDSGNEVWEQNRTDNEAQVEAEITPPIPTYGGNMVPVLILIIILLILITIGGAVGLRHLRAEAYPPPVVWY